MSYSKISIKERVLNSLQHYLMEIRPDNPDWTYNVSVRAAYRPNDPTPTQEQPGTIKIWQVSDVPDIDSLQSTHFEARVINIEIWFFGEDTTNPDSEFNAYEADIKRRLHYPLKDRYHPDFCKAEFFMDLRDTSPVVIPGSISPGAGMMSYALSYRHIRGNPFKWDDSDNYLHENDLEDPNHVM